MIWSTVADQPTMAPWAQISHHSLLEFRELPSVTSAISRRSQRQGRR
jgi:hypothetical protein